MPITFLQHGYVVHSGQHETLEKGWSRMSSPSTRISKGMFRVKSFFVCRCVQRLASHDANSDTSAEVQKQEANQKESHPKLSGSAFNLMIAVLVALYQSALS